MSDFTDFTAETSPVGSDYLVGYRTAAAGGERRTTLDLLVAAGWKLGHAVGNLHGVTGYVGGAATDLDGISTADVLTTGAVVLLSIGGNAQTWQLLPAATAGAASGAAPYEVVEPTDYDASTNARRWKLL